MQSTDPLSESANFQGLDASVPTAGTASIQTTATSLVMQATIQSTEQIDQTYSYNGEIFAQTQFGFSIGVTLSDTSVVTFSGNFQASPPLYTILGLTNVSGGSAVLRSWKFY